MKEKKILQILLSLNYKYLRLQIKKWRYIIVVSIQIHNGCLPSISIKQYNEEECTRIQKNDSDETLNFYCPSHIQAKKSQVPK